VVDATILTVVIGLLGLVLGTFLSPYLNRRINTQYSKIDLLFNKKFSYFEEIAVNIENNIKVYHKAINKIAEKRDANLAKNLFKTIKTERKKFFIRGSPIYFNTRIISKKIKNFIDIEKNIFYDFENLTRGDKISDLLIKDLKIQLENLKNAGSEIIIESKKEIVK